MCAMSDKKVAVITGGSSGIGKSIVKKLALLNYTVINADLIAPDAACGSIYIPCDVTKANDIQKLYDAVRTEWGIPDVLISNAGQGIHEKLAEGDPEKWQKIMDINFMGAMRFARAFVPEMIPKKKGRIIFISSIAGAKSYVYGGIYSASKAALNIAAKTLQLEVEENLKVSLIYPGIVDTPFFSHMVSSSHTVSDIGLGSISADQVADVLAHILTLPSGAHVPEITIIPEKQYS